MSWYQNWITKHAYFKSKDISLKDYWVRLREIARQKGLSPNALEKLEWIIFYFTVGRGNASETAQYFGVSRKTLYKWLGRFSEKNLLTLEEESRAPIKTRDWEVTKEEEERIIFLRKAHIKWGKKKLKVLYSKTFNEGVSTWKIERVIRHHKLYPDSGRHIKLVKAKAKRKERLSIYDIERKGQFGFLWHIDAVIIWWYGARRVVFTAIEDLTKIGFARVYTTNNSGYGEDFLKRLMYLAQGKVEVMHSDNGSEFKDKFEKACRNLGIIQAYSRPRTPTDNPALERFNWTIQDEWLELSETGLDDTGEANLDLTNWLVEYNSIRPHETLDYKTPLEYAYQRFPEVLPMCPARTPP